MNQQKLAVKGTNAEKPSEEIRTLRGFSLLCYDGIADASTHDSAPSGKGGRFRSVLLFSDLHGDLFQNQTMIRLGGRIGLNRGSKAEAVTASRSPLAIPID